MQNGQKKRIVFIINPISGNNKKRDVKAIIDKELDHSKFEVQYLLTEYGKHATILAKEAVENKADIVVAVGGDGTVNEVSKSLIGSNTSFAVVPSGSGNGLARFLKIPLKPEKAVTVINQTKLFKMDAVEINDEYFVNMAGVGFDAHISHLFANYGKRGFRSYLKLILSEYFKYKTSNYQFKTDGKLLDFDAFLISFANSSQFGYNAHIAPLAEINDGLIDVCVLKKFPKWKSLFIAYRLYTKKLNKSKYFEIEKAREVELKQQDPIKAHIDGDPVLFESDLKIKILPGSLEVIVP